MGQPEKNLQTNTTNADYGKKHVVGSQIPLVPCGKGRVVNPIVGFYILQRDDHPQSKDFRP